MRWTVARLRSWLRWRAQGGVVLDEVEQPDAAPASRVTVSGLAAVPEEAKVVVLVAPGTRTAAGAVDALASTLVRADAEVAHADHLVRSGPDLHFHAPRWSPNLLASGPYVGPLVALRAGLYRSLLPAARSVHDLLLLVADEVTRAERVPRLWSASTLPFGLRADPDAAVRALARRGVAAEAVARPDAPHLLRFALTPRHRPQVTAVVPTRDGGDLLARCLQSLGAAEEAADVRVVVVDNGSTEPGTLRTLEQVRAGDHGEVIVDDGSFDFSRLCNRGLERVRTDLVLFVNDDVHCEDPRWLAQLAANLDDPSIGVVGALLRFPDGTIQHAGVVLGLGGAAGHAFRSRHPHDDGYVGLATARREVSAVTGACLLARTRDVRRAAGFDRALPTDFQDVDLCLRLREVLGLVTVVDPFIPLTHHESETRGPSPSDAGASAVLRARHAASVVDDPFYSPRLSRLNPGYERST